MRFDGMHMMPTDTTKYKLNDAVVVEKTKALQTFLETDPMACEVTWTLFVAAACSKRYDLCLRCFPPEFIVPGKGFNIDGLISAIAAVPRLDLVADLLQNRKYARLETGVVNLLHWVLSAENSYSSLLSTGREETRKLYALFRYSQLQMPAHIFKISQNSNSPAARYFPNGGSAKRKPKPLTKLGFYGDTVDSFYSLATMGFGRTGGPIALARNLNDSIHNALWNASAFDASIACVAVCEYVDHSVTGATEQVRMHTSGRIYRTVEINSEFVCVRYLLFCNGASKTRKFLDWITNHKYLITLVGYFISLGATRAFNIQFQKCLKQNIREFCYNLFN